MGFQNIKRCTPYGESDYSRVDITIHVLDLAVRNAMAFSCPEKIQSYTNSVLEIVVRELERKDG